MDRQLRFEQLQSEFSLKDADFYFLDLIPLIEMIWVDGANQEGELKILYQCVLEHIAELDLQASSKIVTTEDANSFLNRFAHNKPDSKLIAELRKLFLDNHNIKLEKRQRIFNFCLDISAACTIRYPYPLRGRISEAEKNLLDTLFKALLI